MSGLNKAFLAERDLQIFNMKKSGASNDSIAKRFKISTGVVAASVNRQISRLNKEALASGSGFLELLRIELERLDHLQEQVWPLAQWRNVTMPDGTSITVEPDLKAVQQIRDIIKERSRLLGLEQVNVQLNVSDEQGSIKSSLAGVEKPLEVESHDPKAEALKLLDILVNSGILDQTQVDAMLPNRHREFDIEDAELVEEPLALEAGSK